MSAYCVGYIEKATGKVLGASIFSEPTPTSSTRFHQFLLFEVTHPSGSYADEALEAAGVLARKEYDWLGELTHMGRFERRRADCERKS